MPENLHSAGYSYDFLNIRDNMASGCCFSTDTSQNGLYEDTTLISSVVTNFPTTVAAIDGTVDKTGIKLCFKSYYDNLECTAAFNLKKCIYSNPSIGSTTIYTEGASYEFGSIRNSINTDPDCFMMDAVDSYGSSLNGIYYLDSGSKILEA